MSRCALFGCLVLSFMVCACEGADMYQPDEISEAELAAMLTVSKKVTASDGKDYDVFGFAAAMSGDLAVIGAYRDDDRGSTSGSVYLYARAGSGWAMAQKLTASDGAMDDQFGRAVAIHGETALVGARYDDDRGTDSGSAYVYLRSGTKWSRQAKLTAKAGQAFDLFGSSVALKGDSALVGAYGDSRKGKDTGAAYIFTRTGTTWTEQQKLTAIDGIQADALGTTVALDEGVAVAGAPSDDDRGSDSGTAFLFSRTGTTWKQAAKLTASDGGGSDHLGISVAVSGGTALVGAFADDDAGGNAGAAYLYTKSGTSWAQAQKITAADGGNGALFGHAVALEGDALLAGAYNANNKGAAYLFLRSGSTWAQQRKITAKDAWAGDNFGHAVALSGNRALLGVPHDDDKGGNSGSAHFHQLCLNSSNSQAHKFVAADGAKSDFVGTSVSVSGDWAMTGAPNEDDRAQDSGAVYVLSRSGTTWKQSQKLTASDGGKFDKFGNSLAVRGDMALVGAPDHMWKSRERGAAYVFKRTGTTWAQTQKLTAYDGQARDKYGAMYGRWDYGWDVDLGPGGEAIVGCAQCDVVKLGAGAAYVYTRSGSTFAYQAKLTAHAASIVNHGDGFGADVSIHNGTALIGARNNDYKKLPGTAYVFTRAGTAWSLQQHLTASNAAKAGQFGLAVSLHGDWGIVTSYDSQYTTLHGAAFVFNRAGTAWKQTQKLTGNKPLYLATFGNMVDMNGERAIIGARGEWVNSQQSTGAAYLYRRKGNTWTLEHKLTAMDKQKGNNFAYSVAIDGDTMAAGAYWDDDKGTWSGSAYLFKSTCVGKDGSACHLGASCSSGFCADGVCCGTACTGGTKDCQACSKLAGGLMDGTCTVMAKGVVCRAVVGKCDVAETCSGTSGACPKDVWAPMTVNCRPSVGKCDAPEHCDGGKPTCPSDIYASAGAICRKSEGPCDVAETCDGKTITCPSDARVTSGTVCRKPVDLCDAAETCDGKNTFCPSDAIAKVGAVCRKAAGTCDVAETCDGKGNTCPTDAYKPTTTECRKAAGLCDVAESCDGKTAACPTDAFKPKTTECRKAADVCDAAESCDGKTAACPTDAFKPATTECRKAADDCDKAESCDGKTAACPTDVFMPNDTGCKSDWGKCEVGKCVQKPTDDGSGDEDGCSVAGGRSGRNSGPHVLLGLLLIMVMFRRRSV